MNPIYDQEKVLVYQGQDRGQADVLTDARAHLIARGTHHLDADDALAPRQGLVVRAWWGGDAVGFVQEDHAGAQPVTVVNLPGGI